MSFGLVHAQMAGARDLRVFVDGHEFTDECVSADDRQGWAVLITPEHRANPTCQYVRPAKPFYVVHGKVEVYWR